MLKSHNDNITNKQCDSESIFGAHCIMPDSHRAWMMNRVGAKGRGSPSSPKLTRHGLERFQGLMLFPFGVGDPCPLELWFFCDQQNRGKDSASIKNVVTPLWPSSVVQLHKFMQASSHFSQHFSFPQQHCQLMLDPENLEKNAPNI